MIRIIVATMLMSLLMALPVSAKKIVKKAVKFPFGGVCSYYTNHSSGRWTANGERFNDKELTAAHWDIPFNTKVRVTNLANGKSVVVRVTDRGPAHYLHRCIDLSWGAAKVIDNRGLCQVRVSIDDVDQQLYRVVQFDWKNISKHFYRDLAYTGRD